MISTAYISLLQFIFLALSTDAMSEAFLHDTTDLPDDPKELESPRQDSHGFPMHSPYRSNGFSFQRTPEELPDFAYHLDRPGSETGSSWDMNSDRSAASLEGHGDSITPEEDGVSKRGSRQFKQGNQKFRFDPALNRLGLGKRDNSDRPKYNPGWKFIGLGKRIMPFLQSMNPAAFSVDQLDRKDFRAGTPHSLIPYYRILAMHDVSMFLDDVNERLNGNARRNNSSQSPSADHLHLGIYSPTTAEEASPEVKHSTSGFFAVGPQSENPERFSKPELFFTRSRKPTSMWRNKSKPMYDPGYLMTGLGK